MALLVVGALIAVGAGAVWRAGNADTDGDGLTDRIEASGWRTADGSVYRTDPERPDTDADGLTDRDEAAEHDASTDTYSGYSDPLVADTDADGLGDGGEADAGLDPRDQDMDDDGLADGYEVDLAGTDPESADTDGDSLDDAFEDAHRESQGLDPLVFDEQVTLADYVADFAKGAVAGDFMPEDSLAWLAGNLLSGVVGTSDLRDALGAAMQGDWVGSGFSVLGALPLGDAVSVPRKVARFVEKNPQLAARTARMIVRTEFVPEAIKLATARAIWPNWGRLVDAGADERSLLALVKGGTDLSALLKAQARASHAVGPPTQAQRLREAAVKALVALYKETQEQVRLSTEGCPDCGGDIRLVDAVEDGSAHTVKVGYVPFTEQVQRQIRKDAWLLESGAIRSAHWHFVASSYAGTLGADEKVLDLLDQAGIAYTIHLPTAA